MFVHIRVSDVINVAPGKFGQDYRAAISDRIGDKYVGKIMPKPVNGLVIALFQLEKVGDGESNTGYIFPGDGQTFFGDVSYKVVFTLVVFRPRLNELFTGKIVRSDAGGVLVDIGFAEIHVPPGLMMPPSVYDEISKVWAWQFQCEDDEGVNLFYNMGQDIRVRIAKCDFKLAQREDVKHQNIKMQLVGACDTDGLGMLSWWNES